MHLNKLRHSIRFEAPKLCIFEIIGRKSKLIQSRILFLWFNYVICCCFDTSTHTLTNAFRGAHSQRCMENNNPCTFWMCTWRIEVFWFVVVYHRDNFTAEMSRWFFSFHCGNDERMRYGTWPCACVLCFVHNATFTWRQNVNRKRKKKKNSAEHRWRLFSMNGHYANHTDWLWKYLL